MVAQRVGELPGAHDDQDPAVAARGDVVERLSLPLQVEFEVERRGVFRRALRVRDDEPAAIETALGPEPIAVALRLQSEARGGAASAGVATLDAVDPQRAVAQPAGDDDVAKGRAWDHHLRRLEPQCCVEFPESVERQRGVGEKTLAIAPGLRRRLGGCRPGRRLRTEPVEQLEQVQAIRAQVGIDDRPAVKTQRKTAFEIVPAESRGETSRGEVLDAAGDLRGNLERFRRQERNPRERPERRGQIGP